MKWGQVKQEGQREGKRVKRSQEIHSHRRGETVTTGDGVEGRGGERGEEGYGKADRERGRETVVGKDTHTQK